MNRASLMTTYKPLSLTIERGEGVWLWDTDGRRYLDALAGVATTSLGHAHPKIVEALCDQGRRLIHASNWTHIALQETLAERLMAVSGMERAFFGNSGAEANEAAIKIARLYGHERGIQNPSIIVTEGAFHGRTLATLSASGSRRVQAGFEPLVSGFVRVPYNNLEAVRQVADHDPRVVAVLVEPVLGEGGAVVPDPGYLAGLRALCDAHGWLFMLDEIQTGMCRTGRWFAWQHEPGAQPDVMTLAKALGNGFPVGACLARGPAARVFQPGNHGSTFGGNPLASRIAMTVVEVMEAEGLADCARERGAQILAGLHQELDSQPGVKQVRGSGLLIGIELDRPASEVMSIALGHDILLNVTAERTVRLVPPLVLTPAHADQIVERTCASIKAFLA